MRLLKGLLRAARPKQWLKNVLVAAAPAAAGILDEDEVLLDVILGIVLFTMVAVAAYLVNDTLDAEEDRKHPTKRTRPIASGEVPPPVALSVAALLSVLSLVVSAIAFDRSLTLVLGIYLAMTIAYSAGLKRVVILDAGIV